VDLTMMQTGGGPGTVSSPSRGDGDEWDLKEPVEHLVSQRTRPDDRRLIL
jgi:hypothetical protein